MDSTAALPLGVLFGSIGLGFFLYGKKQIKLVPLFCGLSLMIYPYFMPNTVILVLTGILLVCMPFFFVFKRFPVTDIPNAQAAAIELRQWFS